jgi:signal transduction histidine kinase
LGWGGVVVEGGGWVMDGFVAVEGLAGGGVLGSGVEAVVVGAGLGGADRRVQVAQVGGVGVALCGQAGGDAGQGRGEGGRYGPGGRAPVCQAGAGGPFQGARWGVGVFPGWQQPHRDQSGGAQAMVAAAQRLQVARAGRPVRVADAVVQVAAVRGQGAAGEDTARPGGADQGGQPGRGVLEDRTRIAEDLHDLVIQRLFAVGLGLQAVSARVGSDAARQRVSAFIDDIDDTIRAIRQTIFSLQQPAEEAAGLRGEALRVVSEFTPALGFEPELTFEGPLDSVVPEKCVPEVLAVLREALSNIARHAHATTAGVTLTADPRSWRLSLVVEDDGVGPGPDDLPGTGTATMAARARRLGGECRLERRDEGGARLRWWGTLDEPR